MTRGRGGARHRRRLLCQQSRLPARRHHRGGQRRARSRRLATCSASLSKARAAGGSFINRRGQPDRRDRSADGNQTQAWRAFAVRGRRPRRGRAAPACRPAAAAQARRGGGAGPSARTRRRAHAHAGDALAGLAGLLGPAGHRQNHGGAAAGAGNRSAFRADFGDLHRRRRPQESVRGSASAGARPGRARCCSSTRSTASTARSRTRFCR